MLPPALLAALLPLLAASRKPNLLLIVADDLGWADVPWHDPDMPAPRYVG